MNSHDATVILELPTPKEVSNLWGLKVEGTGLGSYSELNPRTIDTY